MRRVSGSLQRVTYRWRALVLLCGCLLALPALAASPQQLAGWSDWLLQDHPQRDCAYLLAPPDVERDAAAGARRCAWPGLLQLEVSASGLRFQQRWQLQGESWVSLPGDRRYWPQAVRRDGVALPVIARAGRPQVKLPPGTYQLSGEIHWLQVPQALAIAADTALLSLQRDGRTVTQPVLRDGQLWLGAADSADAGQRERDSLSIDVFRKLVDGVPVLLETELRLAVAGRAREMLIGPVLPPDTRLVALDAPLPAGIEPDGRLRLQLRAGQWTLRLRARYLQQPAQISASAATQYWPAQELWSIDSEPRLRGLQISGAAALDPSQVDLPAGWQQLPTYLLSAADVLSLDTRYRGDETPQANALSLRRSLWLDFDGGGVTVKDWISGRMHRDWQLRAGSALQPGRVSVNGEPQLITQLDGEAAGVELRQHDLQMEALSRRAQLARGSATDWQGSFDNLAVTLNLPPGWQLWHAAGADTVSYSWLSRWDLWDVFLCLLIVGSLWKLIGPLAAWLALPLLGLSYHQGALPPALWLVLLLSLAAWQRLSAGRLRSALARFAQLTLALALLLAVDVSVQQLRLALYPQLARPHSSLQPRRMEAAQQAATASVEHMAADAALALRSAKALPVAPPAKRYSAQENVQTGPGEPRWQWQTLQLRWNGPVSDRDQLQLYLSPPWVFRVQAVLQVLLLWGLLASLLRAVWVLREQQPLVAPSAAGTAAQTSALPLLLVAALSLGGAPPLLAQDYPPDSLLQRLEQRLLAAPDCLPDCAALEQVQLRLVDDQLTVQLALHIGANSAVPLLGLAWQPQQVAVNGVAAAALAQQGEWLWLPLPAGRHEVVLRGPVYGDLLRLAFALDVHNLRLQAPDWLTPGWDGAALLAGQLVLERRLQGAPASEPGGETAAPFVLVNRHLSLDRDWRLTTTVERMAPLRGAISFALPLLPGESVLDSEQRIRDGQLQLTLGEQQQRLRWQSELAPMALIDWQAGASAQWMERWVIESSERWHLRNGGLAPLKPQTGQPGWIQTWWPWPGERLNLAVSRSQPLPGATVTVESVQLQLQPGQRSAELQLQMQLRSSLGGDYQLQLEEAARLQRIVLDGQEQPLPRPGEELRISLHPGEQQLSVDWLLEQNLGAYLQTPTLRLASPASNISLTLRLPPSRWPLWLSGPQLGPAMLYWGVLVVIVLLAFVLGRLIARYQPGMPLNGWQCLLLGLGLSTVNAVGGVLVALWFVALAWRGRAARVLPRWQFNSIQLLLFVLTALALLSLLAAIPQSLLSSPDMQVQGNGSSNYYYQWYQDCSAQLLPQAAVWSLPLWVYRCVMLLWSIWLVFALLRWLRWGWQQLSHDRWWQPPEPVQAPRYNELEPRAPNEPR